jgi:hypothetical protein
MIKRSMILDAFRPTWGWKARLQAPSNTSWEGIDKLIAYLGLIKGSFPKEGEA